MPVARAYPIPQLIAACDDYFNRTGRRVTYEYTLIDGVNDRPEDAAELKNCWAEKPHHHINLIPLNPVTKTNHKRSNNVNLFAAELKKQFTLTVQLEEKTAVISTLHADSFAETA